jgi:hypothetical protein
MAVGGRCQFCGQAGPVVHVTYRQNTGMLVMRQSKEWAGLACKACSLKLFGKTFVHNLFLGWWGMISFVLTSVFMLTNTVELGRTLFLPSAAARGKSALEGETEYAKALLGSKDFATVVEVLVQRTGAPAAEVEAFLKRIA